MARSSSFTFLPSSTRCLIQLIISMSTPWMAPGENGVLCSAMCLASFFVFISSLLNALPYHLPFVVEPGILFSNFLYCNIISFVFLLLILLLITTCFRNTDAKVYHPRSPTAGYCALQRFGARCCRLLHVIATEIVAQVQKIS